MLFNIITQTCKYVAETLAETPQFVLSEIRSRSFTIASVQCDYVDSVLRYSSTIILVVFCALSGGYLTYSYVH